MKQFIHINNFSAPKKSLNFYFSSATEKKIKINCYEMMKTAYLKTLQNCQKKIFPLNFTVFLATNQLKK